MSRAPITPAPFAPQGLEAAQDQVVGLHLNDLASGSDTISLTRPLSGEWITRNLLFNIRGDTTTTGSLNIEFRYVTGPSLTVTNFLTGERIFTDLPPIGSGLEPFIFSGGEGAFSIPFLTGLDPLGRSIGMRATNNTAVTLQIGVYFTMQQVTRR